MYLIQEKNSARRMEKRKQSYMLMHAWHAPAVCAKSLLLLVLYLS